MDDDFAYIVLAWICHDDDNQFGKVANGTSSLSSQPMQGDNVHRTILATTIEES